jgi:hypothetical protein
MLNVSSMRIPGMAVVLAAVLAGCGPAVADETVAFCRHVERYDSLERDSGMLTISAMPQPSEADSSGDFALRQLLLVVISDRWDSNRNRFGIDAPITRQVAEQYSEARAEVLARCRRARVR